MVQQTKHSLTTIFSIPSCFHLAALFAIWAGIPYSALAQNSNLAQIQREHLITNGMDITETGNMAIYVSYPNWYGKSGYCPVRVRVVPRKGLQFKDSGQLQVIFGAGSYNPSMSFEPNRQVIVNVPIEAGTTQATGEMLGNFMHGDTNRYEMQYIYAKLNGRKLRAQNSYFYGAGNANNYECKYLILISEESAKNDSRRQEAIDEMAKTENWYSQESNVQAVGYTIAYADVRKIPSNWLYISGIGGIAIEFEDLARLDANGRECINQYVLDGGYLTINKVTSASEVSSFLPIDLNRRLGTQKVTSKNGSERTLVTIADFEPPTLDLLEDTIWDDYQRALGNSYFNGRPQISSRRNSGGPGMGVMEPFDAIDHFAGVVLDVGKAVLDSEIAPPIHFASQLYDTLSKTKSYSEGEVVLPLFLSHGLGYVHLNNKRRGDQSNAFEDLINGKYNTVIVNPQILYNVSNRTSRLGGGIGDDFWDWLIPSVGRTPAIPFLAFVVLFVGIGVPGIMYWSNRHKRRIWLVILMPLIATLCTLLLFSYGFLKDGFGAVLRTRSLSFIDDQGNGMVWSRQSYFAATVSKLGMDVGEETYLAPMPVNPYVSMTKSQQLDVEAGQKYVGVLPPRLQTQFSISHPLRNLKVIKRTVEVDPVLQAPSIQNDSDFTWSQAVFVDPHNEFFVASNTEQGQRAVFAVSTRADAELLLQKEYKTQELAPPADSPSADQTTLASTFNFMGYNKTGNATGQIIEEKVWESQIGKSRNQSSLTPGTFVIFTKDAPYLEKCLPNAKEQDGVHMIVGRW